jgi:hypothetical protein
MTIEEELVYLREENTVLREQLAQRDELIQQQHGEQMSGLSEQLKALQDRLAKDSHNSHLPPSSDRFVRKPKSLRKKSEKQSDGQPGHAGSSLAWTTTPDEIIEQHVERCEACQHDLQAVAACGGERRQVVDLPSPRLVVREYRAEQKEAARKPQRATSPMVWAAILPMPLLVLSFLSVTSFDFGPQNILKTLSFFLNAVLVSGATALIVKIRMRSPRFINPKVLGTCAFLLLTWLILTIVSLHGHIEDSILILPIVLAAVSTPPAFFVRVLGGKQQGEGASEPPDIGAGPKVWGWFLFLLSCNYVFAQIGLLIFNSLNQGQGPLPLWIGPNEELLATLAAICLIPAVIVKVRISNRWA